VAQSFTNVLIYEDAACRSRKFLPLTYTRSVAELRTGAFSTIVRVQAAFREANIHLHVRPEIADVVRQRYGLPVNQVPQGPTLLLNAREALSFNPLNRWRVYDELPEDITTPLVSGAPIEPPDPLREDAPSAIWDVMHQNAACIKADAELWALHRKSVERPKLEYCAVINPKQLLLHPNAKVDAGVVLDCSDGEIIIDDGARVMTQSTIIGPCYIGKNSLVKIGAKIYSGTTVGPVCKVGGEIENSIFQGYANKQHDGYVGHSFIGEWCNLGAGTNTSDLKNDYSPVRVMIEGEEFNTGSLFVGLMMGDHSKSGIGTQFNTGTAVGVSSNIFDAGFPPKWIPNFSWGGASGLTEYRYDKALQVANAVTQRRNVALSEEETQLLRSLSNR
jgi:hypothetical protein